MSCVDMSFHCYLQGLHSASVPGILSLDLCPSDTSKVLTGKLFSFSALFQLSIDCISFSKDYKSFEELY